MGPWASRRRARALTALLAPALWLAACGGAVGDGAPPSRSEQPSPQPDADDAAAADHWQSLGDAPLELSEVTAAAFGGQVWVAGGLTADGDAVRRVQIFDPAFATWTDGPELPEPVHHAALVSSGEELYVVGGYVGAGFDDPTTAVHRLDPDSPQWREGPPLPAARAAGAAAWDGARVVYGGGVGPRGVVDDVLTLDAGQWRRLGRLSQPREHLAAASDGRGRTWFLAGRAGGLDRNLGTVDVVDGADVTFLDEVPTPRGGVAAFWSPAAGACVVGGEETGGTFAAVECVDGEGSVRVLPDLRSARHGLGAAVADGAAYVVLGGPEPGLSVSGAVEALRLDPPP